MISVVDLDIVLTDDLWHWTRHGLYTNAKKCYCELVLGQLADRYTWTSMLPHLNCACIQYRENGRFVNNKHARCCESDGRSRKPVQKSGKLKINRVSGAS